MKTFRIVSLSVFDDLTEGEVKCHLRRVRRQVLREFEGRSSSKVFKDYVKEFLDIFDV